MGYPHDYGNHHICFFPVVFFKPRSWILWNPVDPAEANQAEMEQGWIRRDHWGRLQCRGQTIGFNVIAAGTPIVAGIKWYKPKISQNDMLSFNISFFVGEQNARTVEKWPLKDIMFLLLKISHFWTETQFFQQYTDVFRQDDQITSNLHGHPHTRALPTVHTCPF